MKKILFLLSCMGVVGLHAETKAPVLPIYESVTELYSGGPDKGKPVFIPAVTHYGEAPFYRGINLSGLEYDGSFEEAVAQRPDIPDALYFAAQGMNFVRLPIRAEFIVPDPDDKENLVNMIYLGAVYDTVRKYLANGLTVELDLQNSMRFCSSGGGIGEVGSVFHPVSAHCTILTADQLAHIWTLILTAHLSIPGIAGEVQFTDLTKQYPELLMFGVMNAPFDDSPTQPLATTDVLKAEVAAAKAIQAVAPKDIILLSGNGYDSLRNWMSPVSGNAQIFTMSALKAAGLDTSKIAIEVQQFFDWSYDGRNQVCNHYGDYLAFEEDMAVLDGAGTDIFGSWIKKNSMPIFLSAFGGANTLADGSPNLDCRQDMVWMLQYVDTHAYNNKKPQEGGFVGWALWHANRNNIGLEPFNFLQQANPDVYAGKGIMQGTANGLMSDVIAKYLVPPKK